MTGNIIFKTRLCVVGLVMITLVLAGSSARAASIVTRWLDVATPAADYVTPEPTAASRFFAVLYGSIYEAWAAYDPDAHGVVTGPVLKGTGGPATLRNKREAISHAAYFTLSRLAPVHQRFFDAYMAELGYDSNSSSDPAQLGRRAAAAVLAYRGRDGANQAGGYEDTSNYMPRDASNLSAWQPILFDNMEQEPITPHWPQVMPFALAGADEFRPPAPPAPGTPEFDRQIEEVLDWSASLTDAQKALAEYWVPFISHPSSHLMELTKWVSYRDDLTLDEDVVFFFVTTSALMDAGIAAWDAKYHYDYVRPVTAIKRLGDQQVRGWASPLLTAERNHLPNDGKDLDWGRQRDAVDMAARDWEPYLPTPPFPEYVSGHSTFTAAWARVMELMTGDTVFGHRVAWPYLYVEDRKLDEPVILEHPTFLSATEGSGWSRLYGGIHWRVGHEEGVTLGQTVAGKAWRQAQRYLRGNMNSFVAAAAFPRRGLWHSAFLENHMRPLFHRDRAMALEIPGQGSAEGAEPLIYGGLWRSVTLSPPARGWYRLEAQVAEQAAEGLAKPEIHLSAQSSGRALISSGTAVLEWCSDGKTPLRLQIQVKAAADELPRFVELKQVQWHPLSEAGRGQYCDPT